MLDWLGLGVANNIIPRLLNPTMYPPGLCEQRGGGGDCR